jgi:hypothetical protein
MSFRSSLAEIRANRKARAVAAIGVGAAFLAVFAPEVLTAIIRKVMFIGLLGVTYKLADRYILAGFETVEVLKTNAVAIALLLGLLAIAAALA